MNPMSHEDVEFSEAGFVVPPMIHIYVAIESIQSDSIEPIIHFQSNYEKRYSAGL